MGHKVKVSGGGAGAGGGAQSDLHYENRVVHKERECNQQTTHHVGKTGSVRTRARSRVSSRAHSGAPSAKSDRRASQSSTVKRRASGRSSGRSAGDQRSRPASRKSSERKPTTRHQRCYDQPASRRRPPCVRPPKWQTGRYVRDECGSGIVPKRFDFRPSRRIWCRTPLSMYQATIGELGRKLLCREAIIPRDVRPGPPCNVEQYILPPCRGYYRKYDCVRPCEEQFATLKQGKKVYRDRVQRYWEPCLSDEQKHHLDINTYAHQNVALGLKVRRFNVDLPCC